MRNTKRLEKARMDWARTPVPADRFRAGDEHALTYGIELDLDHQASYLNTMLMAIDQDDPHWDFGYRADYEPRDLLTFRDRLVFLQEHSPPYAPVIVRYMDATAELLRAIIDAAAGAKGTP